MKKILIKGSSGTGKTTLVNLIVGCSPKNRVIEIDGKNIYKDLTGYHKLIAYVSQSPFIFSDTISGDVCLKKHLVLFQERTPAIKNYKENICGLDNIEKDYNKQDLLEKLNLMLLS